jgi:hypothetical protein
MNMDINYMLYDPQDGTEPIIVKTVGPPTYKKVELDPTEAYQPVHVSSSMYADIIGKNHDLDTREVGVGVFCPPSRKIMVRVDECDLCQRRFPNHEEDIHCEYTDRDNHQGYFYCTGCTDIFYEGLKNTGTRDIWYLRERPEWEVWIPRTRRDENGVRIYTGPIQFEKWSISGWFAHDMQDANDGKVKPHLTCEGNSFYKSVPIEMIKEANPEDNPDYCPNNDPKWSSISV